MKRRNVWTTGILALSLCGAALPVAATTTIWGTPSAANCSGPVAASGSQDTVYQNCAPPAVGGTRLTYSSGSDTGASGTLAEAYVGVYTGEGVTSGAGPHSAAVAGGNAAEQQETTKPDANALDNSGNYEAMLLRFSDVATNVSTAVGLNVVTAGSAVDSDLTVLAYSGRHPSLNLMGKTYTPGINGLVNDGWTLVGNYADVASNTPVNRLSISASYWLIAAYNNAFGSGAGVSTNNDYVRLLSMTTSSLRGASGGAPEPSSILLAATALLALIAVRRRRPA